MVVRPPVVRRARCTAGGGGGGTVVFFALVHQRCPRKGRPHKSNHVYFHFFPDTQFGYYQCTDTQDCGPRFRWAQRCYCLEATGLRCPRCAIRWKYWGRR